jgi:hypothetical protein
MYMLLFLSILKYDATNAWSGIILDSDRGHTQLYVPDKRTPSLFNVSFGLPHMDGSSTVMLANKAYFIGGCNRTESVAHCAYTSTVMMYNPHTNTSINVARLNHKRGYHAATTLNGTIIVCGGSNSTSKLSSCEQFVSNRWKLIPSLPEPVSSPVMLTLHNRVYVFGGLTDNSVCGDTSSVHMYDGDSWTRHTSMPVSLTGHAGVALDARRALVCGGYTTMRQCQPVKHCYIYSASTDKWKNAPSMAHERCEHSIVLFFGELLILLYNMKNNLQMKYTYLEGCVVNR